MIDSQMDEHFALMESFQRLLIGTYVYLIASMYLSTKDASLQPSEHLNVFGHGLRCCYSLA